MHQIKLSKAQSTNIVKDNKIVYFITHDWRNPFWRQNKIFTNPNKFNGINHSPFNKLSATKKILPTSHYGPINTTFNILLSSAGSKIYSSIASLFSALLPSKNQPKSVVQEYKTKEEKRETAEKKEDDQNNINNLITSKESQPFTSLITKVISDSYSALSSLEDVATSTANNIIESCQEGGKYNLRSNGHTLNLYKGICNILLWVSARNEYLLPIKILLPLGANPNVNILGVTPLCFAVCANNQTNIAELLFKYGADINSKSPDGYTILHKAIFRKGKNPMALWLITKGATIDTKCPDGNNALHLATERANIEVMTSLLQRPEIEINAKNSKGYTALHLAAYNNYRPPNPNFPEWGRKPYLNKIPAVKLLLDHGADVNALDNKERPVIYHAVTSKSDWINSTQLLLDKNADINCCDKERNNLLLLAAQHNNFINFLIYITVAEKENIRIDINAIDNKGHTALYYAIWHGIGYVNCLLDSHAPNVNLPCCENGDTPILFAAKNDQWETVKLLAQHKANIDQQDQEGKTALYHATNTAITCQQHNKQKYNQTIDVISFLVKNGANITLKDHKKITTPIQIAIDNNNFNIAYLMCNQYTKDDSVLQQAKQELITALESHRITVMLTTLHNTYKPTKSARKDVSNNSAPPQQVESGENEEKSEEEEVNEVESEETNEVVAVVEVNEVEVEVELFGESS